MRDGYDVIVIGAGPGGEVLAGRCAEAELSTCIIERQLVGGECSFWGCMPSKGLLRPQDVLAAARRVPGAREAVKGNVDVVAALDRRNEITNNWDDKYHVAWLEERAVDVVRGVGRIVGPRLVEVETDDGRRRLSAGKAVVVATGSQAAIPPIEGLRDVRVWDNRDVTEAQSPPRRLLVLGGGVIGVEMAQAWRSLGAGEITIIEAAERLIPMEEPFAGDALRAALEAEGVTVLTGSKMVAARRDGADGEVTARLENGVELVGDEILVAVGRRPNTGDLGVESVGLAPGRPIEVDDHLRAVNVPGGWLYAIGDANGRALLTHMAKYQARCAADDIIRSRQGGPAEHAAIPRIVFTDPQVAAVGMTAEQARAKELDVRIADTDLSDVAGALVTGLEVHGGVRLVIDAAREVVVGATFVGPDVGDMLHAATIAIVGEVPVSRLRHAVPSFPSLSEVWLKALEGYEMKEQKR